MHIFTKSSAFLLVTLGLLVCHQTAAHPQWDAILASLVQQATSNMWQNNRASFMGYNCQYTMEPTFHNWELNYRARFWCPGLAPFSGAAMHVSRDGSIERAQKDFAQKCLRANLFTREELAVWLV